MFVEHSTRPERAFVVQLPPVGTGTSPPALKAAVPPDTAVRLGSAKVRKSEFLSSIFTVAEKLLVGRLTAYPKAVLAAEMGCADEAP
jgi:hypothetical protein